MLVLTRKPGEKILVGDDVVVTLVRVGPNSARIGVIAPRTMRIKRSELDDEPSEMIEIDIPFDEGAAA